MRLQVLVTVGATEALAAAFLGMVNEGDEVRAGCCRAAARQRMAFMSVGWCAGGHSGPHVRLVLVHVQALGGHARPHQVHSTALGCSAAACMLAEAGSWQPPCMLARPSRRGSPARTDAVCWLHPLHSMAGTRLHLSQASHAMSLAF